MHTVFASLCFVVVIHWLIFPYPSGLLHWHCGNLTIAPVPAKQPWWIWINTSCEFIMNDCITTTKQSTTKPCAYFLGYTVTQQTQHNKPVFIWMALGKTVVTPLLTHCSYNSIALSHWHLMECTVTAEWLSAWTSYQIRKIVGCACAGNAGNLFPATDFNWNH